MRVGSLFSGVGGLDLGLELAGHEVVWQAEMDNAARAVLKRHWPDIKRYKDVGNVGPDAAWIDLLCGGFPCQDISRAGSREGLGGQRSGAWFEFARVVGELAPTWVLIENVPDLLLTNGGRDMGTVIRGLEERGYVGCWRVLDAIGFGVPQRRRRLFVLARRGAGGPCPAEVLALAEGVCGDTSEIDWVAYGSRNGSHGCGRPVLASGQANAELTYDFAPTINLNRDGSPILFDDVVVTTNRRPPRRLMPEENERLQGFPVGWTKYGVRARGMKELADKTRNRLLGNAVAVPVARWIGERLS